MKVKQAVGFFLALVSATSFAQAPAVSSPTNAPLRSSNHPPQIVGGEIITHGGIVYKGVVVQKMVPDGIVISYSQTGGGMGIAKLKFTDLSDRLQQEFGYNPTNAMAFEKEQRAAESQWQAQWAADDEKAKAKRNEDAIADAESRASGCGSGFFISDNGYLLTCYHVVKFATSIQVGTKHGLFDAILVQSDPDRDLALLKVAGTFSALPLISSNSVNFGESVFTIGFPNPKTQGWEPKLTRGEISSLSGFQDDTNHYQISVPVQPGNSGGALVDENGNVVGLVQARLRGTIATLMANGMLPENVNYAIKSSVAKTLLNSVPETWPLQLKQENAAANRKLEDVIRQSQDAVALVLIQ